MHTEAPIDSTLPAAQGNHLLLLQGLEVLETLPRDAYGLPVRGHSPVGAQFRHVLEHYEAFFAGLPAGRVDYDARPRDASLESDPMAAARAARQWCTALLDLSPAQGDAPLLVQTDSGAGPDVPDWRASTVGRELQFLASHTTHHFALIALLLEFQGWGTPPGFGVAPSTRAYLAAR